ERAPGTESSALAGSRNMRLPPLLHKLDRQDSRRGRHTRRDPTVHLLHPKDGYPRSQAAVHLRGGDPYQKPPEKEQIPRKPCQDDSPRLQEVPAKASQFPADEYQMT